MKRTKKSKIKKNKLNKRTLEKLSSLQRTVLDLAVGILLSSLIFEIGGLLFVKQKLFYSVGILYGAATAIAMMLHMAYNLNDALSWDEENAGRIAKRGSVFRYLAVTVVTGIFAYLKLGNLFACFLGLMSLKAAAYAQPMLHKSINHIFKIKEEGGEKYAIIDDEDTDDLSDWFEHRFYDTWFN